jgi:hypothetical protein
VKCGNVARVVPNSVAADRPSAYVEGRPDWVEGLAAIVARGQGSFGSD